MTSHQQSSHNRYILPIIHHSKLDATPVVPRLPPLPRPSIEEQRNTNCIQWDSLINKNKKFQIIF